MRSPSTPGAGARTVPSPRVVRPSDIRPTTAASCCVNRRRFMIQSPVPARVTLCTLRDIGLDDLRPREDHGQARLLLHPLTRSGLDPRLEGATGDTAPGCSRARWWSAWLFLVIGNEDTLLVCSMTGAGGFGHLLHRLIDGEGVWLLYPREVLEGLQEPGRHGLCCVHAERV